ncbi:MAG: hypothetical protein KBF36_10320 [Chitinophagaceae bacterium]|nr:hypothetical protein [Chitinophagaceae bacterium]MBP9740877.1 hypothetical protein [Chitinophagaceae bacterium]
MLNKISKKQLFTSFIFLLLTINSFAQSNTSYFFASKHCRDSVTKNLITQIEATITLPPNELNYKKWSETFWAMELMLYTPKGYEQLIPQQIKNISTTTADFQRSFLEMLYTLYQKKFSNNVAAIWETLATDKIKAMALEYMANATIFPAIKKTNPFYNSAYYTAYIKRWKQKKSQLPKKKDFLSNQFLPGQTVLCSFQSTNRDQPGHLMIRNANGQWRTDENDVPLKFPQLARSINNLPYYLTNGNTPQGLFKITGLDTSNNNWIGPTTNLQMVLPFENGTEIFFSSDTLFEIFYTKLLGPLKKYTSLMETFEAGKLGRSEIIAHGTTINPAYYQKKKYFPNTPSMGCLCSPESWNEKGERIYSSQAAWINELQKIKKQPTYLIVADISDL